MRPEQLLRLYPRAWRKRYGDEFLAAIGRDRLRAIETLDVALGALDAWLSSDVRLAATGRGGSMLLKALVCENRRTTVTPRDGIIGALVMIVVAGICKSLGQPALAFPIAFTLSMPFWLMKGAPWRAQAVIVGVTLTLLVLIR